MNLWTFSVPRIMSREPGTVNSRILGVHRSINREVGAAPGEVVGTSTSSNQKSSEEGKVKNLGLEKTAIWELPSGKTVT